MKKILIMTFASLVLLTGCGKDEKENNNNNNNTGNSGEVNQPTPENPENITNQEMIKDQTVETLKFTQTEITYDGSMTKMTSQVTNTSDQVVNLSTVMAHITYTDVNKNERVLDMVIYFGETLQAGETRTAENYTDVDLRNATKIEYEIVR